MYIQRYEAYSIISDISLHLDEGYASSAMAGMILAAILAFALTLFAAIAIKRARVFGVIVALAQPVGLYAAMQMVLQYATIDFSCLEITRTSSISMDDAMAQLYEALGEAFAVEILPQAIGLIPWLLVFMVVSILSLVYAILLIKAKGKGMAITAMILMIVKYLFFSPIEMLSLFMQQGSSTIQSAWDFVFRFVYLLPLFLIALQGIINLVANAKAKKAAAAAPAAPAEPAEAPAEDQQ